MRRRRARTHLRPPHLEHDHRLAVRTRRLQRFDEPGTIAYGFGIGDDDAHRRRPGQPQQAFGQLDVGLVAGRDPIADADAALSAKVAQVPAASATLAGDGHRPGGHAGLVQGLREGAEEAVVRIERSKTVRPQDAHRRVARDLRHGALPLRPGLVGFRESGGKDDHHPDALRGAGGERIQHLFGRQSDDGQIDRAGDRRERGMGRQALHQRPVRVDRIDGAAEAGLAQVADGAPADARRVVRSADDGHRSGLEQRRNRCHPGLGIVVASPFKAGAAGGSAHLRPLIGGRRHGCALSDSAAKPIPRCTPACPRLRTAWSRSGSTGNRARPPSAAAAPWPPG